MSFHFVYHQDEDSLLTPNEKNHPSKKKEEVLSPTISFYTVDFTSVNMIVSFLKKKLFL